MLKIKEDKMQELEKFGYQQSSKIVYPRCLEKCVGDMLYIRIYNDKLDEEVEPYIQDLIEADMVEKDGE